MKPLWCPLYSGVHYRQVPSELNIFCPKNCSRVLGYSAINQSVSKDQCWEKKEPKGNILEDIMYIWLFGRHWLTSVCNAWNDQPSKWKRRMLLLWFVLILTVKKKVVAICNRNINDCILVYNPASLHFGHLCNWKRIKHGGEYGMEILETFHFYKPEKTIKLAKR